MGTLTISTSSLQLEDLAPFLAKPGKVRLSSDAQKSIKNSNKNLKTLLANGTNIYGVNTGFGKLSNVSIPASDQKRLQLNLVRSHASGVGKPFAHAITRVTMILKLLTFTKGVSGVRYEVAQQLIDFINHDIFIL